MGDVIIGTQILGAVDGTLGVNLAETHKILAGDETIRNSSVREIMNALAAQSPQKSLPYEDVGSKVSVQSVPDGRGPSTPEPKR